MQATTSRSKQYFSFSVFLISISLLGGCASHPRYEGSDAALLRMSHQFGGFTFFFLTPVKPDGTCGSRVTYSAHQAPEENRNARPETQPAPITAMREDMFEGKPPTDTRTIEFRLPPGTWHLEVSAAAGSSVNAGVINHSFCAVSFSTNLRPRQQHWLDVSPGLQANQCASVFRTLRTEPYPRWLPAQQELKPDPKCAR
jgi:hypothetical protein